MCIGCSKGQSRILIEVPDVAYTDPGHGREMIVELKFINAGPTRYDRD